MTTIDLNKALEIAENTTVKHSGGSKKLGEVSQAIVDLLTLANKPLHCHQIASGLTNAGLEVTSKTIADKCWLLSGGKENKEGVLEKMGNGMYQVRKTSDVQ